MRMIFHLIASYQDLKWVKNGRKWPKMAENRQKKQKRDVYAISSGITLVIRPRVGLNVLFNDNNRNTDT